MLNLVSPTNDLLITYKALMDPSPTSDGSEKKPKQIPEKVIEEVPTQEGEILFNRLSL